MAKTRRAALYLRVSTDGQSVENQRLALQAVVAQRGWSVVAGYDDNGISGAKGRDRRSGLGALLNDATRGRFDVASTPSPGSGRPTQISRPPGLVGAVLVCNRDSLGYDASTRNEETGARHARPMVSPPARA